MSAPTKEKLRNRLNSYWKLELWNVALMPAFFIILSASMDYPLGFASYLAMIPMCGLLYIGGIYWRAKYKALDEGMSAVWQVMPMIHRAKKPLALLSVAVVGLAVGLWVYPDLSRSRGDQWTATAAASLALLEYINYYHRQLQHFDHAEDFKRLFTGKGFRRAQLAKDLKVWRRRSP